MTTHHWRDVLGDEVGMMFHDGIYPDTSEWFTNQTGITPGSLYLFDKASGNIIDVVGSADLAANGTPTYGYSSNGRRGVYYDAAAERHASDVNDPGSTSFVHFGLCTFGAAVDFAGCFGRTNATGNEQWIVWMRTVSGIVEARIRDDAAGALTISTTGLTSILTRPCLVSLQIDRAATTARLRVSDGTTAVTASGSIAGFGSLTGAAQVFGFGAVTGTLQGTFVGYGGYFQGSQAEGASVLQNLHEGLGWG